MRKDAVTLGVMIAMASGQLQAGGFQLFEQSAVAVGSAFSDQASARDATTVFWNPAGMTHLTGKNIAFVGNILKPTGEFSNQGSSTFLPPPGGLPLSGGSGGDPGSVEFVPGLFYTQSISNSWALGLGVNVPFGLSTSYDTGWVGRYYALDSELRTVNINPSIAYQVNERLSFGVGLDVQYVKAELSKAIDFSTVCLLQSTLAPAFGAVCNGSGFNMPGNQATDGVTEVEGDDWGVGWNVGMLLHPTPDSKIGIAYRSKISYDVEADARFRNPANLPAPLAAASAFSDGDAQADLTLPENLTLSGAVKLSERWELSGAATWTRWSRFDEVRIRFANGAADAVTPFRWENVWRVSAGASYRLDSAWTLRGGVAYDESPVTTQFRSPTLPDADRTILSIGASYQVSPVTSWDVGYAHFFVHDAAIALSDPAAGRLAGVFEDPYIDVLSVQFNRRF